MRSFYSQGGRLEIICGPMYSGKSEELIRRLFRSQISRQKIQVFKPAMDTRFHKSKVVSRTSLNVEAIPVQVAMDILEKVDDITRVVGIDEVQFFDTDIVKVVQRLVRRGIRVICSGLDQYHNGDPFGPMPQLLALADQVDKIHAICTVCGAPATKTHIDGSIEFDRQEREGSVEKSDSFEARCRAHYDDDERDEETFVFSTLKRVKREKLCEKVEE